MIYKFIRWGILCWEYRKFEEYIKLHDESIKIDPKNFYAIEIYNEAIKI